MEKFYGVYGKKKYNYLIMCDSLVVNYQLDIYEEMNYSSITFAPLPKPENINQVILNLSKYILWAKDSKNDLKGKNNSLNQGSRLIPLWKENEDYNIELEKILITDTDKQIYNKMLKLSMKKEN